MNAASDSSGVPLPGSGWESSGLCAGGSSVPILMPDQIDIPASFDDVQKAGSLLGSAAIMVLDETTDMVWLAENLLHFYRHESCGKCTPCREGTYWLAQIYERLETGAGTEADIEKLLDISDALFGKSFCALGDGAASPILSSVNLFRGEYEAHVQRGCPFDPAASMLMGAEGGRSR